MKKITFIFFLIGILFKLQAQETITGIVSDEFGVLENANILIKNSKKGTVSNSKGRFEINGNRGDTLQISYLGYRAIEIPVMGESKLEIMLKGNEVLDEVTVIGYGRHSCGYTTRCYITSISNQYFKNNKENEIVMYPNTSPSGVFSLKFLKVYRTIKVNVANMSGQSVKQMNFQNLNTKKLNIDLSQFSSGMYIISIIADGKKISTKKVVKG